MKKRIVTALIVLSISFFSSCEQEEPENNCTGNPPGDKTGILFLHVGSDESYKFDWQIQFFNNLYDFFDAGQFVGGPNEGNDCYTLIHYANEAESAICGVEEETPIDVFCNIYENEHSFPVHPLSDHSILGFISDCAGSIPDMWPYFMLSAGHTTIHPSTGEIIEGPIVTDPAGAGLGIPDFLEMAGFQWMETMYRLPNFKDIHREQIMSWWYGNDISDGSEYLENIKDTLLKQMPDAQFVFRHGWESYMENLDPYGNPKIINDSTETAIKELIEDEGVSKIIVAHTYPSFSNLTQYGHEWYDDNGQGISAIPGKTFKECIEDINDGYGPSNLNDRIAYLNNKPFDSHWKHPFPLVKSMVEELNPCVEVSYAPPYGDFEEFNNAVTRHLEYTVQKYTIDKNASLKVILGHHGYFGGYKDSQDCDCYFDKVEKLYQRVSDTVNRDFQWQGRFELVHGASEYAEGEFETADPPDSDNPFGNVMSIGEEIEKGINGVYVNSQGILINNGIDNFDYIIVIPYFFESESTDTIYGARLTLGNNIPPGENDLIQEHYKRDNRDIDGTPFDSGDLDSENFTVKVYDASGWASTPTGLTGSYNKGGAVKPTTVIVTGTILSPGNSRARTDLTQAAVNAILSALKRN